MMLESIFRFRLGMLAIAALSFGCAAVPDPTDEEELDELEAGGTEAPIIGGTKATGYPEAALIDMNGSACSGALISPKVVLTAGHCVGGFSSFSVTLPFAGGQKASGTGKIYDYNNNSQYVDPNTHDVGVIVLSKALSIDKFPLVANKGVPNGTKVQNIGRINNGSFSNTALFISQPLSVNDAKSYGFPFDYIASEVIQPGDSGGPVVVANTHNIVAVNSGAGGGTQVLARVDLLASWIKGIVDQNGGGGYFGDPLSDQGGGGNVDPDPQPQPDPGTGDKEAEPNNSYQQTNPIKGALKGELTSQDQDWFTWSVGSTGVKYNITVQATGNAQIQMWKLVNGTYYKTPQTSPTQISQTSTGAGQYFMVVHSATGAAQSYTVTLTK